MRILKRIACAFAAVLLLVSALTVCVGAADDTESAKTYPSLDGLKILFCGDSITAATVDNTGWPGRIAKMYDFEACVNLGVPGALVSNATAKNILTQVRGARTHHKDADIIILHGGTNDANQEVELGEMTEGFEALEFDKNTFAGGLENTLYYAKGMFSDAALGYVINFKFRNSNEHLDNMEDFVDMTIKILEKWDVPYVDLYHNEELTAKLKTGGKIHFRDDINVHPNERGYDIITPYIASWLEQTYVTKAVETTAAETTAAETTAAGTAAETTASGDGGCGAMSAAVLVPTFATLCVLKKKRDD